MKNLAKLVALGHLLIHSVFQVPLLQLVQLIQTQYEDQFSGPDKYFKAIEQVVDDSEFNCVTELLAQVAAKSGSKVFRFAALVVQVLSTMQRCCIKIIL